ncbi:MAG: YdcF family protein [Janthinobacterium lividum]
MWRLLALALTALFAAALLWLAGFTAFEADARRPVPDSVINPDPADGIVVLTGGADRIETGLRLLAAGQAPRLLISGVGTGIELSGILRHVPIDPALLETQIVTLGHAATNTVGNAAETAAWARRFDLHSIIVVTAGYHMARAIAELARALPDLELRPMPVRPPALRTRDDVTTLRLLAIEFDKLLAVRFGLTRLKSAHLEKGPRP